MKIKMFLLLGFTFTLVFLPDGAQPVITAQFSTTTLTTRLSAHLRDVDQISEIVGNVIPNIASQKQDMITGTCAANIAQSAYWAIVYGDGTAHSVHETRDGGFIVAGEKGSSPNAKVWILKLDSTGDIIWQKTYGFYSGAYSIQETSDGGFIVAGYLEFYGTGNIDYWILRLDSEGNIIWQKTYDGSDLNIVSSIQETNEGGFIVAGYTESFGRGYTSAWIWKLSSDGTMEWQKAYGGTHYEYASSIQETSDGGFIIAGGSSSLDGSSDLWVLKLGTSGAIEWQRVYDDISGNLNSANFIQETVDGGFIVVGWTLVWGVSGYDVLALKLSSNGAVEWQKSYGGYDSEQAHFAQETNDGGFVVVAHTLSFGVGNEDIWILKLNSNGTIAWQKTYGGIDVDRPHFIREIEDSGFIVAGEKGLYSSSKAWILKLDVDGDIPGCGISKESNAFTLDVSTTPTLPDITVETTSAVLTNTTMLSEDITTQMELVCRPEEPSYAATIRVSLASHGTQGNDESGTPSISASGRYVAFVSAARYLVNGDFNNEPDIFVHDLETRQTTRVSVASDGTEGNDKSDLPTISADGRYVAFESSANNLVSDDTNDRTDVFVHDRVTNQTTRVSVASDGTQGARSSTSPFISADGRYVVFESSANNLVSDDTNGKIDIFVHDRVTEQTTRVSVASDGTEGNNYSVSSIISADGRYVTFESSASNLVSNDTNDKTDVFVHDQMTNQTILVSTASDGTQGNNLSDSPAISTDGRYVVFYSSASNLVGGDTNGRTDVFVHDRVTNQTTRVSVSSDGTQGNGDSEYGSTPAISADGRYIVFSSYASNLVSDDTNDKTDIFVHDQVTGQTTRVSIAANGTQGNDHSSRYDSASVTISAGGNYVAFSSYASNLVSDDINNERDVFVHNRKIGGSFYVSGRVTDNDNQTPISDVIILINSGDSITTNASGYYTITGLITDTYTITPTKEGYTFTPVTRTVSVPPDATGQDFTGTSGDAYIISGYMKRTDGTPIADVIVDAKSNSGKSYRVITGDAGFYAFLEKEAGTYVITPTKEGYTFIPITRTVSVPPDATEQNFTGMTDGNIGGIRGVIIGTPTYDTPTYDPLPGVQIQVSNSSVQTNTVTDEDGLYIFDDLPVGTYLFRAGKSGYAVDTRLLNVVDDEYTVYNPVMAQDVSYAELAGRYAPVWYQDIDAESPEADYITNFDFDDNWDGTDNWQNQQVYSNSLKAYVYYSVIESETHWFIIYADFHPRDWGPEGGMKCTEQYIPRIPSIASCHENDMEGVLVVVKKDGITPYGEFHLMATVKHIEFIYYSHQGMVPGTESVQLFQGTHPMLYVEPVGHGVEAYDINHFEGDGVVEYIYEAEKAQVSGPFLAGTTQTVKYDLKRTKDDLWERRYDWVVDMNDGSKTYRKWARFAEDETPEAISPAVGARPPWGWGLPEWTGSLIQEGDFFFNSAFVIEHELDGLGEFSQRYIHNPYCFTDVAVTKDECAVLFSNDGNVRAEVCGWRDMLVRHSRNCHKVSDLSALGIDNSSIQEDLISQTSMVTSELASVGHPFDFSAVYLETGSLVIDLQNPYELAFQYTDDEVEGVFENSLKLYWWNGSEWIAEPTSVVDEENNIVTAMPEHMGDFSVLGIPKTTIYLPLVMHSS